jgi:hypothetical protein
LAFCLSDLCAVPSASHLGGPRRCGGRCRPLIFFQRANKNQSPANEAASVGGLFLWFSPQSKHLAGNPTAGGGPFSITGTMPEVIRSLSSTAAIDQNRSSLPTGRNKEQIMRQISSASDSTTTVEFPVCPTCGALMQLSRIEPDQPGQERRFFECVDCASSEDLIAQVQVGCLS